MIEKTEKKYFKLIILGLFCFSLIIIGVNFFSVFSIPDSSYNFGKKDETRLYPNFPIIQKFRAQKNNLNQINIVLNNVNLKNSDKIIFELNDESCNQVLAKDEMTRFSQQFSIFEHFSFPTINNSKEKIYCFKIKYIPTENKILKKNSYPQISTTAAMLFTEKFENTRPGSNEKASSLVMRPAYTNGSVISNLSELKDRISQDKPWFLKNSYLITILTIFATLLIILIFSIFLL